MAGKRPTDEEISDLLRTPHFGEDGSELPQADPIAVMQLVLTLEQIKPYDRNPRRERNPRYDEIKASIRAQKGLNTPLNITRRPGDTEYMVEAGGNTRLQILQELWEETKEECFFRIHTQYRPWISESHVLTAHLVENELRGEMTLLDKALGVQTLKEQLEQEAGEVLSRNEFLRWLKDIGYCISKRQVIRMQYLAERLYPLIPTAAQSGLAQRDIDNLRDLEKAYFLFWCRQLGEDQADQFQFVFGDILSLHDEAWDLERVRIDLNRQFSELSGLEVGQLETEVDALLYGEQHQPVADQQSVAGAEENPEETSPPEQDPLPDSNAGSTSPTTPTTQSSDIDPAVSKSGSGETRSPTAPPPPDNRAPETPPVAAPYTGPSDLKSLRARNFVLALQLAQRHDLSTCIHSINTGMGFVVDLPEKPFSLNATGNGTGRDATRQFIW